MVRKDNFKNLERKQLSIWFDVAKYQTDRKLKDKSFRHYSSETSMLIEDLYNGVFPPAGFTSKKYKVEMEASDQKCNELFRNAIERQYPQHDLTESIYLFAQECVQCMATYGQAPYEIVYFEDGKGIDRAYLLNLIMPASFHVRKNGFKQYIPPAEVVDQSPEGKFIDLPAENILLFELPFEMKHHESMMDSLSYFGGEVLPKFAVEDLMTQSIPFKQADYFRARELAVAHATKDIGWNARNYTSKNKLEFYVWYRQLKFYRFQILIRDSVIETFNEGLARVGKRLGFEAKLSVNGLPTMADADNALEKLLGGDLITFTEVLAPFR